MIYQIHHGKFFKPRVYATTLSTYLHKCECSMCLGSAGVGGEKVQKHQPNFLGYIMPKCLDDVDIYTLFSQKCE